MRDTQEYEKMFAELNKKANAHNIDRVDAIDHIHDEHLLKYIFADAKYNATQVEILRAEVKMFSDAVLNLTEILTAMQKETPTGDK